MSPTSDSKKDKKLRFRRINRLKQFLFRHKKPLLIVLIFSLVATVIFVYLFKFYIPENVANVRGRDIKGTDYKTLRDKLGDFNKYNSDSDANSRKQALNSLIMEAALEDEANKHHIRVEDSEIEAGYREMVSKYEDEAQFIAAMDAAYGWTTELAKRSVKIRLLQDKLSPFLLNTRDAMWTFARWDENPYARDKTQEQLDSDAKEILTSLQPFITSGATQAEIDAKIKEISSKNSQWTPPLLATHISTNLNQANEKLTFVGREDWKAISKLEKVGDHSDIVKSSGGYYSIYRLTTLSQGKFDNWDSFLESVKKEHESEVSILSYKVDKKVDKFASSFNSFKYSARNAALDLAVYLKVPGVSAYHSSGPCSSTHMSGQYGYVYDRNTNQPLSGASLSGRVSSNSFNQNARNNGYPYCGEPPTVGAVYSAGNGYYRLGESNNHTMSCFVQWDLTYIASNYQRQDSYGVGFYANGSYNYVNIYMSPNAPPPQPYSIQGAFVDTSGNTLYGTAYASDGSSSGNTFYFGNRNQNELISANQSIYSGGRTYNIVGYSICYNNTYCHYNSMGYSNQVYVYQSSAGNYGYADLRFYYRSPDNPPSVSMSGNCDYFWGYAYDNDKPSWGQLQVSVYTSGWGFIGTAYSNSSNGYWVLSVPSSYKNSGTNSFFARVNGVDSNNNPNGPSAQSGTVTIGPCERAPTGSVNANCSSIYGTASDADSPSTSLAVDIYVNSAWIGTAYTSNGSWNYPTPDQYKNGNSNSVYAYARSVNSSGQYNGYSGYIGASNIGPCLSAACESLNASQPIMAGSNFTVTASFRNNGQMAWGSSPPYRVEFYSTNGGGWSGSANFASGVAPGGTVTVTTSLNAPRHETRNLVAYMTTGSSSFGTSCSISSLPTYIRYNLTADSSQPTTNDVENPAYYDFRNTVNPTVSTINPSTGQPFPMPNSGASAQANRTYFYRRGAQTTPITPTTQSHSNPHAGRYVSTNYSDRYTVPNPSPFLSGDEICNQISVVPATGLIDSFGNTNGTSGTINSGPICSSLKNKPYFRVYNNDAVVGGGFDGVACSTDSQAAGWTRTNDRGAGVEYALSVSSSITEVLSASLRGTFPSRHIGLTFANTNVASPGNFGSICKIPDYYSKTRGTAVGLPSSINLLAAIEAQYQVGTRSPSNRQDLVINGLTLIPGTRATIFVEGNVRIERNIDSISSWANIDSIPSLVIVAKGNVSISPTVTNIDATIVAQPYSGGGGTVYTCGDNAFGGWSNTATHHDTCKNQLTITGVVIAKKVKLLRTFGTLRRSSTTETPSTSSIVCDNGNGQGDCAAERFNFSPEWLLAKPNLSSGGYSGSYDDIKSLPPTL